MSDQLNPHLVAALERLNIPLENYKVHPNFQALPAGRDSRVWDDFKRPPFDLNVFELGSLQNARCATPPQEGKC
jgi:hypothetical protein